MIPHDIYRLLHLADSALPSGGYAFSNGLEGAFQLGLLSGPNALYTYLYHHLKSVGQFDLPFLYSSYHLNSESDLPEWTHMFEIYDASLTASTMRRSSLTLGRSWLRLIKNLHPEKSFSLNSLPHHFTLVLGMTLRTLNFSETETKKLFLYMTLRDMMSAAIRLGLIGPMAGSKMQMELYPKLDEVLLASHDRGYAQARKSFPEIELSQTAHARLYSRLFQN